MSSYYCISPFTHRVYSTSITCQNGLALSPDQQEADVQPPLVGTVVVLALGAVLSQVLLSLGISIRHSISRGELIQKSG